MTINLLVEVIQEDPGIRQCHGDRDHDRTDIKSTSFVDVTLVGTPNTNRVLDRTPLSNLIRDIHSSSRFSIRSI